LNISSNPMTIIAFSTSIFFWHNFHKGGESNKTFRPSIGHFLANLKIYVMRNLFFNRVNSMFCKHWTKKSKNNLLGEISARSTGLALTLLTLGVGVAWGQSVQDTFTSSGTWTCPAGVTSITVECWGGGGAGGNASHNGNNQVSRGGGGAGGAYARREFSVIPGSQYSFIVGAGGVNSGGVSTRFIDPSNNVLVLAVGGRKGGDADKINALGALGTIQGCVGDVIIRGGNGGSASLSGSGGGGGGAGSLSSVGGDASGQTGGSATNDFGGSGSNGRSTSGTGFNGSSFGGGGSGAIHTSNGGSTSGGNGAPGLIRISFTQAVPTISSLSSTSFCSVGGQTVTINGSSFAGASAVLFNGVAAVSFDVTSGSTISAVTPAGISAGVVSVTTPAGSGSSPAYTVNSLNLATPPLAGDLVWRGVSNSDWATISNWWQFNGTTYVASSVAPASSKNVIVPANQLCVQNLPNTNSNTVYAKSLRIENGASLTMGNGTLVVAENWLNNGTFNPGSGTVVFNGSGTHTISGSSASHNFNNLTMDKTGEVELSASISLTGTLTLTNGRLNIGNYNLDLPVNTVNGGNASSYVRTSGTGTLNRNVENSAVLFPVGRSAYNPATLTNSGAPDKFSVRVIDNVTDDGTAEGAPTSMAVVNRTWMIDEQMVGGSNVTLKLQWNSLPEQNAGFSEIGAFVAHYLSSEGLWDNIGGTVLGSGIIQATGITGFSPFTVSSDNAFAPLPVELLSFSATCSGEDVLVEWVTASEFNSQYFEIEFSRDGFNWESLTITEASGFSTSVINYSYLHKLGGSNKMYYRLLQFDNDGATKTYSTIMANCASDEAVFMTFPNPSADAFTVVVNDELLIGTNVLNISDASGKLIYSIAIELENGSGAFALDDLDLPGGLYYLQLNNGSYASRIIKHSFR
jgi:hypothetical protein